MPGKSGDSYRTAWKWTVWVECEGVRIIGWTQSRVSAVREQRACIRIDAAERRAESVVGCRYRATPEGVIELLNTHTPGTDNG